MPLTTIGAQFEAIRQTQGEAAALAFLKSGVQLETPTIQTPSVGAFGPTGTLQQVFNFANRINRDRLIAQQRIEAAAAVTRMEVRRGFAAVAAAFGRL